MRVMDILEEPNKEDAMERKPRRKRRDLGLPVPPSSVSTSSSNGNGSASASYSPRFLLSRWFSSRQKTPRGGGGGGEEVVGCRARFPKHGCLKKRREEEEVGGREWSEVREEMSSLVLEKVEEEGRERVVSASETEAQEGGGAASGESTLVQGDKSDVVPFSLGLGVGLALLMSRSATEFDKMIELRTQMEMLLKDIRDQFLRKDASSSSFSESNSNVAFSMSNSCTIESRNKTISLEKYKASSHSVWPHCSMESARKQKSMTTFHEKTGVEIDQMEAELEVELERLQINMEGEGSSLHPSHHWMEKSQLTSENTDPSGSVSRGDADELKEGEIVEQCGGVSARELERRLHELLEERHQERIAELEFALGCAEKKLHEKDTEICWWRDTAKFASQRKNGTLLT